MQVLPLIDFVLLDSDASWSMINSVNFSVHLRYRARVQELFPRLPADNNCHSALTVLVVDVGRHIVSGWSPKPQGKCAWTAGNVKFELPCVLRFRCKCGHQSLRLQGFWVCTISLFWLSLVLSLKVQLVFYAPPHKASGHTKLGGRCEWFPWGLCAQNPCQGQWIALK